MAEGQSSDILGRARQVGTVEHDIRAAGALLPNLATWLDEIEGNNAWVRAASLLLALRERLTAVGLADALLALTDAEIATFPSAYRHENGYLKIPLLRSARSGAGLRLNLWNPDLPSMENIHTHRWDFASWVVVGSLNESLFCDDAQGRSYEEFSYASRAESDHYQLVAKGMRNLTAHRTTVIPAGVIYERHYSQLHQSFPAGQMAITLQVTHSPQRSWSSVFRRSGEPIAEVYHAPALEQREVRRQFELLAAGSVSPC